MRKVLMKKQKRKPVERCVCGKPINHPPIPPGRPWDSPNVPQDVIAAGHVAHAPSASCQCAVCNSLR